MNRAFPGDPRGTLSYRISNFMKTRIFPQVRIVIDLHAGGREAVFPLCTSFHPLRDPEQHTETALVARLFDTPFIFIYSRQMASGLLTDEAEDEGKIAIGGEFGHAEGQVQAESATRTRESKTFYGTIECWTEKSLGLTRTGRRRPALFRRQISQTTSRRRKLAFGSPWSVLVRT